jgi:hypothetical protein
MNKYIYVSQNGINVVDCPTWLLEKEMQLKVGVPDEIATIRIMYKQFSHIHTVCVFDEDGITKRLPIMGITRKGIGIKGAFIIASKIRVLNEHRVGGMNEDRVEIALREITLVRNTHPSGLVIKTFVNDN